MRISQETGEWLETAAGLQYIVEDQVQFADDFSHWYQGFCRLLELPDATARNLIEDCVQVSLSRTGKIISRLDDEQKLQIIAEAVKTRFPPVKVDSTGWLAGSGTTYDGTPADTVFAGSISGNASRMVVGSSGKEFAWQLDATTKQPVPAASVTYDSAYYDSPTKAHCGMKDYVRDDDWRMEKSRRLMRTVLRGTGSRAQPWLEKPDKVLALDVGSAMGYFRKAMAELGFDHFGIDLSPEAISICRERFGFDTWRGSVFDLPEVAGKLKGRLDLITLWDTIEHLDDPLAAVKLLSEYLAPQGVMVVRTPSLTAVEADLLGDRYYSYKLDHIRYFSPASLSHLMKLSGLEEIYLETTSHLFKGLLSADFLHQLGRRLKGADIVAVYGRI
jgi:2-polyprenyl-3-methyl-5-hydroxy-6-metoxy-1,4-benzoquinol methylase